MTSSDTWPKQSKSKKVCWKDKV